MWMRVCEDGEITLQCVPRKLKQTGQSCAVFAGTRQVTAERNFLLQRGLSQCTHPDQTLRDDDAGRPRLTGAARTSPGQRHETAALRIMPHRSVVTPGQQDSTAIPLRAPTSPLLEKSGEDARRLRLRPGIAPPLRGVPVRPLSGLCTTNNFGYTARLRLTVEASFF